jgi:hypothetical protein
MTSLHLIERDNRFQQLKGTKDEWESGYWSLPVETAEKLVGGDVYFHEKQRKPSFFGGEILGFRTQEEGPFTGRLVLRFRFARDHKDVAGGGSGWTMEKKIVF